MHVYIYVFIHHKMVADDKEDKTDRQTKNGSGRNPQVNKILIWQIHKHISQIIAIISQQQQQYLYHFFIVLFYCFNDLKLLVWHNEKHPAVPVKNSSFNSISNPNNTLSNNPVSM